MKLLLLITKTFLKLCLSKNSQSGIVNRNTFLYIHNNVHIHINRWIKEFGSVFLVFNSLYLDIITDQFIHIRHNGRLLDVQNNEGGDDLAEIQSWKLQARKVCYTQKLCKGYGTQRFISPIFRLNTTKWFTN